MRKGNNDLPQPEDAGQSRDQSGLAVDLESLLSSVLEREGAVISVAPAPKRRKDRPVGPVIRISAEGESPSFHESTQQEVPAARPSDDAVRVLDHAMLYRIDPRAKSRQPRNIGIRFERHESSGYVLKLEGSAQKIVEEAREAYGDTIARWAAPFEAPPEMEVLLFDAKDLHVGEIEPHRFVEQFTPADPDVAYAERYHWWSKWRSPFIRWEIASNADELRRRLRQTECEDTEAIALYLDDQFTPSDADQAYKEQFGARRRFRGLTSLWRKETEETADMPLAGDTVESVADMRTLEDEIVSMPMARIEPEPVRSPVEQEAEPSGWDVPMVVPKLQIGRVMVGFIALALLVTLPAIGVTVMHSVRTSAQLVTADSKAALADVQSAIHGQGVLQNTGWDQASLRFQSAQRSLSNVNTIALAAANAIPQTRRLYQSAAAMLQAGDKSAQAASLLTEGVRKAMQDPVRYADERLLTLGKYLDSASPLIEDAVNAVSRVTVSGLPKDIQPKVEMLKEALSLGQTTLRDLRVLNELLIAAAGHDHQRRYLFVFQNHTELRPTGGFMGSLAEVTVDRGELTNVFVPGGGPYDFRDQLLARVAPPKPLQLVGARWEFQDANWFPDFPTAAKKIRWFWSKSGQPTIDGVVAVNATILEKLLTLTGPIAMPEYGKTVTAENVMFETQKAVELEYDKEKNTPKKFVGDLLAKVIDRLKALNGDQRTAALAMFADALETKEIQVSMTDADEDAIVQAFGWSGRIAPAFGDALAIIEANIAGQKTDAVINERVQHEATIQSDGTIIDTVSLTRTHTGERGELFRGANNVEYLRVYVPKGSKLISAEGFMPPDPTLFESPTSTEPDDKDVAALVKNQLSPHALVDVTEEFDRTAFGGWIQLRPGDTTTTRFAYQLPFTAFDIARNATKQGFESAQNKAAYVMELTSQSGKMNRDIQTRVTVPPSWESSWTKEQDRLKAQAGQGMSGQWDRDYVTANVFDTSHDASRTAAR